MTPIYKDTYYTFTADTLSYYVMKDTEIIYQGRAFRFPDAVEGKIQINRIAEDYIKMDLPRLSEVSGTTTYTHLDAVGTFQLYDDDDTLLATYEFAYDWNYDNDLFNATHSINANAADRYAQNEFEFDTKYYSTKDVKTIIKRATANDCGDWAIYYLNRKGGWDSYLIKGKVRKTSDFNIGTYENCIDNNYADYEREKVRYKTDIGYSWELNTGWLKDGESELLSRHLFPSNYVFLHDLTADKIYPVVITDKSVETKTFANERKLFNYTINVENANKEMVL